MQNKFEITIHNTPLATKDINLECNELIRRVDGKRMVYGGNFDGKNVIIKIYQSRLHGRRNYKQDLNGFTKLTKAGIPTAKILASGKNEKNQYTLVLERIENARDVFSIMENSPESSEAEKVISNVFRCLAKMHKKGIIQKDLHLGNFLWNGKIIYALDPAQIKFQKQPLSTKQMIKQLSILLASFPVSDSLRIRDLLDSYMAEMGESIPEGFLREIESQITQLKSRSLPRTLRKTLRSSKRYAKICSKNFTGVFLKDCFEGINLDSFMQNIETTISNGSILKDGTTCFVSKIEVNGKDVVVKRYNNKGLWHSFRQTLKRGRARKCWLFGHRLSMLNIPCAKPLAFIEMRKNGLLLQSYIINDFIEGLELTNLLLSEKYSDQDLRETINSSKEILNKLVNSGITHGDMKTGNMMIAENGPVLIDLDSMKLHRNSLTLKFYANKMLNKFDSRIERVISE